MTNTRRAEISGAGFAGLTAAVALAKRGWSVRVHEKSDELRTEGAGIVLWENSLRVLESLGALPDLMTGSMTPPFYETRTEQRDRLAGGDRGHPLAHHDSPASLPHTPHRSPRGRRRGRRRLDGALGHRGRNHRLRRRTDRHGRPRDRRRRGRLSGARLARDPNGSRAFARRHHAIPRSPAKGRAAGARARHRVGQRHRFLEPDPVLRVLYVPANEEELYIALMAPAADARGSKVPIDVELWTSVFPQLAPVLRDAAEHRRPLLRVSDHPSRPLDAGSGRPHRRRRPRHVPRARAGRRLRHG